MKFESSFPSPARENWDSLHKQMNLQETMVWYLLILAKVLKFHSKYGVLFTAAYSAHAASAWAITLCQLQNSAAL